jgi:uncharacterized membrane protein YesL
MKLFNLDGPLYQFLSRLTDYLILTLLWFLLCIPVVTIFPATAAMFGVVRQWVMKKDPSITSSFFTYFKENFKQSFLMGIVWIFFAVVVFTNYRLILQMPEVMKVIMVSVMSLFAFLFLFTSVYLFPVMVHFRTNWMGVIRNSFLLSISQLWVTIRCLFILFITVILVNIMPFLIFIIGSFTAYLTYYLCDKSFQKLKIEGARTE